MPKAAPRIRRDRLGRGLRGNPRRRHHGCDRFTGKACDLMGQCRRGGTVIGLPSGRMNTDSVGIVPISSATRPAPV
jgi:hypothetical protein